ncbi:MAG: ABC transporter substrate-binding protein [Alkalibacterium sp.]|nr:ABC transporter substrate-binding protein [Alkalibacterium sp.]
MNRTYLLRWGVLFSALVLAGCGDSQGTENEGANLDNEVEQIEESVPDNETQNATVTIEDAVGNNVEVPLDPERVAVFDNGQLDNMAALGLEDRVVLTASPNLPEHLSYFEDTDVAGSFFEIDMEVTNAAQPDLIIVAGRSSAAYDDLAEIAPTIDLSNDSTQYIESISSNLTRLSDIFDLGNTSDDIIEELETQLSELNARAEASELTTLVSMYNEGSLSAYGPGSRFGVVHDAFGFQPVDDGIEQSNHGMEIAYEYVLSMDPDIIFLIDRTAAIGGDATAEPVEENPIIQQTSAYQSDSIHYLSPSAWYLAEGGVETFKIMMQEVSEAIE